MKIRILLFFCFFIISNYIFGFEEIGVASWYGPKFHGKKTANGEIFDTNSFTAAHRTLAFGSIVKVISLDNNKETIVRITDRGSFAKNRIIDLSKSAAEDLDMIKTGTTKIKIILLENGDNKYYKYSPKRYKIQMASFSDEEKAKQLLERLKEKIKNINIKKIFLDKIYFRVITEQITYNELQSLRILMNKENLKNYKIIKN